MSVLDDPVSSWSKEIFDEADISALKHTTKKNQQICIDNCAH